VGAHAFLGNNAAATRDVPPYLLVSGMPAEPKGINSEGLKRRDFSAQQIANLKNAYRVLYRSGLRLSEATVKLAELARTQPEVQPLVDFLGTTTRSIVR
jgi:UDP-N-acetylglucosamine acyltransferase